MHILIVDDDAKYLESYLNPLIELRPDWELMISDSTGKAISYCRNVAFSCVLAHMQSKGIDHYSLRRELLRNAPNTPCIMLSKPYATYHWTMCQLGLSDLLLKPIEPDLLVDSIEKAVDVSKFIRLREEFLYPAGILTFKWEGKEYSRYLCSDYLVGRDMRCDIMIPSSKVSRNHFQLSRDYKAKSYLVSDTSRNGIEVNGHKVMGYQLLKHDDKISIPGCDFFYTSLNQSNSDVDVTHSGDENEQGQTD